MPLAKDDITVSRERSFSPKNRMHISWDNNINRFIDPKKPKVFCSTTTYILIKIRYEIVSEYLTKQRNIL